MLLPFHSSSKRVVLPVVILSLRSRESLGDWLLVLASFPPFADDIEAIGVVRRRVVELPHSLEDV